MSQGNWGGGPPGGGGPGGWGGGGPPGAPPGGGGYGPPAGGGGYGPPGGAPPGGGYGPPGAPPGGGYGPPGGAPPGGGYGPPGGAPPGGGYGPPPGGGGYGPPGGAPPGGGYGPPGAPPGGGGYGPPPGGGGYGAPPGGASYGPPPGGDFGPPPGAMAPIGQRVQFNGQGGALFVTFLLWGMAPVIVGAVTNFAFTAIGNAIDGPHGKHHSSGPIAMVFMGIGILVYLAALLLGGLVFRHKFIQFHWDNTIVDGQRCRYVGTPMSLFTSMILHVLLTSCTMGIYSPWMWAKYWTFVYDNTEVNGQRGRLKFTGDPGSFLGKFILGAILSYCTLGIYGAWFYNDVCAFFWENSQIDGRGFGFRKDGAGFLGTYIVTALLSICTLYIYIPWGICNIMRWEAERVT